MRLFVTVLALLCLSNSVCLAQRSRRSPKKEKPDVEVLISSYRFNEAAEVLEEDIANAKRRRKPTETFEAKLDRVRYLQVLLSATEKVRFVDSLVIDKDKFLNAYRLGADCGVLGFTHNMLPKAFTSIQGLGDVAYRNQLNDKIYFSVQRSQGLSGLHSIVRIGDSWSKIKPLNGIAYEGAIQDFPYVLSDGVTMYYAEKNESGLGGYDIYVTRYNPDTDSYLKSENIGMPFNSMANDYLYAIDELNNLGWFVTDRNQPSDKVCVYIFQPNVTRQTYNQVVMGEEMMRRVALLHSMDDSRLDQTSLEKARTRLQQLKDEPVSKNIGEKVRFIISDNIVYTSLLDFKHRDAQRIAMEWVKLNDQLLRSEQKLESLRGTFNRSTASKDDVLYITQLETTVNSLRDQVAILAKKMRKLELR